MATKTVGRIRASSLIWALQQAWELPPELCKLTALFWESRHVEDYRRRVMMELEALCVRVALMASCSLHKATAAPVGPFSDQPRVWKTTFAVPDLNKIPLFNLPQSDVVTALDARVRQLPFLERYTPACHPGSTITRSRRCGACNSTVMSCLDAWAKFPEGYPDEYCAGNIFVQDGLKDDVACPIELVFQKVWQLCHAGGTGTSAEKTAEERGTIEDALRRLGCLLVIQFEYESRKPDPSISHSVRTHVLSVTITETIRTIKPFEQTGVECLRDAARHPKRTAVGSAKVRRVRG